MLKEIVIESKKFDEIITITSKQGIDLDSDIIQSIIGVCGNADSEEVEIISESVDNYYDEDLISDTEDEPEEEIIFKHHYKSGCYCDSCNKNRGPAEISYHTCVNEPDKKRKGFVESIKFHDDGEVKKTFITDDKLLKETEDFDVVVYVGDDYWGGQSFNYVHLHKHEPKTYEYLIQKMKLLNFNKDGDHVFLESIHQHKDNNLYYSVNWGS